MVTKNSIVLRKRDLDKGSSRYGISVTPHSEIKMILAYAAELARFTTTWFYVSASLNNVGRFDHALVGEWVGEQPADVKTTRAFHIGPSKVIALSERGGVRAGRLYRTPCRGMKYAGGLRLQDLVLDLSLSISKLDQAFDQLFTALVMYKFMFRENQIPTLDLFDFNRDGLTSYLSVSVKDKRSFQRFMEAACGVKMVNNSVFEIQGKDDTTRKFVVIVV